MAYLNDNPQLQSLNSIIKFHLEVCWGALSKLGVIDPKIYSHLASIHVSEARCCHRSSKLTLALHIGSPLGVILSLGTFCRRECFLYISILRTLPCIRVLHHMNMHTCLSTNNSTYHPLWASFKCCVPLIVMGRLGHEQFLFSFSFIFWLYRDFVFFFFSFLFGWWRGTWHRSHMTCHMMWCHKA